MSNILLILKKILANSFQLVFGLLLYYFHKDIFVEYSELTLVNQYVSYLYLGLPYAVNFFLSSDDKSEKLKIISNTASLVLILSLVPILILFLLNIFFLDNDIFKTCLITLSIISLNISLYVYNIWRSTNSIYLVNYSIILLYGGLTIASLLVDNYLVFLGIIILHGFFVYIWLFKSMRGIDFDFDFNFVKKILSKGLSLLIYNISYYLYLQSLRTIIRFRTNDDFFADISFSQTISNSVFLLMGTVSWVFYSKILTFFSRDYRNHRENQFINQISKKYYSITEFLVYVSFSMCILFYYFFNLSIELSLTILILLLSNLSLHSIFPLGEYLISKNKQNVLSKTALIVLLFFLSSAFFVEVDLILILFFISTEIYTFLVKYRTGFLNKDYLIQIIFRVTILIFIVNKLFIIIPFLLFVRIPFLVKDIYETYKLLIKIKIR